MCSACRIYAEPVKQVDLPWKTFGFGQRVGEIFPMRLATIGLLFQVMRTFVRSW